jgi:hypothetical protein
MYHWWKVIGMSLRHFQPRSGKIPKNFKKNPPVASAAREIIVGKVTSLVLLMRDWLPKGKKQWSDLAHFVSSGAVERSPHSSWSFALANSWRSLLYIDRNLYGLCDSPINGRG